jgi:hypothetical protein
LKPQVIIRDADHNFRIVVPTITGNTNGNNNNNNDNDTDTDADSDDDDDDDEEEGEDEDEDEDDDEDEEQESGPILTVPESPRGARIFGGGDDDLDFFSLVLRAYPDLSPYGSDSLTAAQLDEHTAVQTLSPADVGRLRDKTCTICLDGFEPDTDIRRLPCLDIFHVACIDVHFKNSRSCPLCRTNVLTQRND